MVENIVNTLGVGSGIDITRLVSQLSAIERAPYEQRLNTREEQLQAQISGYGKLKSALSELQSSLTALSSTDVFNARTVAVPDTTVITANSVAVGAQTGTFQIEVLEVARAHSLATAAQDSRDSALGKSGEMTIRFGTWTYDAGNNPASFAVNDARSALTISVSSTDSLDSIAEKINAAEAGVQASVVKVDDRYQLMLTSLSGKANALEVTVDDASLDDFAFSATKHAKVTETQQANDAQLKVNGLSVTRETNDIDDVIEGLDFTLNKAAPGETLTFTISADKNLAEEAVRDFVEAYNAFQTIAQELTGYTRNAKDELVRGDLAGDGAARAMIDRVRGAIGAAVPGLGDGYTALTNVGIRTERDGSLSIDETDFSAAFSSNFKLVERLFALTTTSENSAVSVNMGTYAGRTEAGSHTLEITRDPTRGELLANHINHDFSNNNPLDTSGNDYSFKIKVNGVESGLIELSGTYYTAEALRADLQSSINGDPSLKGANALVDVFYDADDNRFRLMSREYGSTSTLRFTEASASMADLGIDTSLVGTDGVDVAGTVDGVEGFGAGNILLPDIDSSAYGLNFTVGEGAAGKGPFEVSFSRGFAGELSRLIDGFLSSEGTIEARQDSIRAELEQVDVERERLDRRMEAFTARITSQFIAMETIVSSFQTTGRQLEGLADRMPFTAKG